MSKIEKYQQNRLRSSYLYVVLSIALVLFVLGLLGILVLQSNVLAKHFKEQVSMNIFLNDDISKTEIQKFQKKLTEKEYVKSIHYISKDSAAQMMEQELGEDFLQFLGTNPLKQTLEMHLKSEYVTLDSVAKIRKDIGTNPHIYEISYDEIHIDKLDRNIEKITLWVLVLSGILTMIAVLLINSTIRLSIYSKRFTIKTMQMVGATKNFIRKPFIITGIKLGIAGSVLAIIALYILAMYFEKQIPDVKITQQYDILAIVFGGILILGIVITGISTYFATRRFLNLRTEELYY
ncbi:MAG: ABC transporter permease [Flavobacteriaceae bacterium]|jgi:cell division transport system permease protein|nr:ABC transporter permease [Flavobacteriaceae bacterium]